MSNLDSRTRWLALYVLCLGDLMIVLDVTIVGVALPSIRTDLGFSETSLAWIVNAYLLTFGGFLLLGGRLGDLFGHRRLFVIGTTLFTIASLACGLSNTQELLIGARAVQGIGAAIVSAVALSLMMTLFTEAADRAKAMGIFGFVASGGGSIGVLLGGILTDVLNWHWIFLVNVPVGVLVVLLTLKLVPSSEGIGEARRLDVAGAVTVTVALMLAVYAIVNGNENGWASAQTLGVLGAAIGLFADLPRPRVEGALAADAAPPLQAAQPRRLEHRRHPLGRGHVRLVLHVGALPPARARLQPAAGRPRLPARERDHGHPLGRRVREARHALRLQAAPGDRADAGGPRARCSSRGRRSTAPSSSTCSRA